MGYPKNKRFIQLSCNRTPSLLVKFRSETRHTHNLRAYFATPSIFNASHLVSKWCCHESCELILLSNIRMKSRRECIVCWAQVCDAALSVKVIIDFDRTYSARRQQPPYLHTFYVSRQMINTDSLSWNLCQRHICFQTWSTYIRPCNSDLLSIMHCHSSIPSIFNE